MLRRGSDWVGFSPSSASILRQQRMATTFSLMRSTTLLGVAVKKVAESLSEGLGLTCLTLVKRIDVEPGPQNWIRSINIEEKPHRTCKTWPDESTRAHVKHPSDTANLSFTDSFAVIC